MEIQPTSKKATFSIPSIIAVIAAIASFWTGATLGLILAGVAFVFGIIGAILAVSPKTRGGIISIIAVALSFIGVIAAVVKFLQWVF